MRFQIEKAELLKHIQYLSSVVPTKSTTPILNNYRLEAIADTNRVSIIATDLELTVIAEFEARVIEEGTTAVNARSFNEIVHSLPDVVVDIHKHEDLLKIQCSKIDFSLLCADHTLFPELPSRNLHNALGLNAEQFHRMINKTAFAVSTDVNRAVLTGVCWVLKSDSQLMAATDGRKVSEIKYLQALTPIKTSDDNPEAEPPSDADTIKTSDIFESASETGIEKIVPVKTLNFLQKIYNPGDKELVSVIEPNRVMFVYNEYTVFSQVLEHKYPDYQRAFIHDLPNTLLIDKDVLKTAIRRVALIAPEDNLRIRFEIKEDSFEINTTNRESGEAKEMLDTYAYTGSPCAISFNYKYMLSILDAIDQEKVKICLGTQKDPIMIYNETQTENQEITFLLMPLRS